MQEKHELGHYMIKRTNERESAGYEVGQAAKSFAEPDSAAKCWSSSDARIRTGVDP